MASEGRRGQEIPLSGPSLPSDLLGLWRARARSSRLPMASPDSQPTGRHWGKGGLGAAADLHARCQGEKGGVSLAEARS